MSASAQPQRCLITGGAGFIGSHLVEHLVDGGHHVVVIDNYSTGRAENLASVPAEQVEILQGDVSDVLAQLDPTQFDVIYHLAASVGVRLVIERPIETIENNVSQTAAVLEFAAGAAVPILVASTSEVYGKSTKTPFAEDDDVVYGPTIYSRWSYACSKAIDEYLALAHAGRHGLPAVVARFFNTVGPRQVGRYGMVIPRFVEAALSGTSLQVHGDGKQTRCFCDVRDVVEILPRLLANPACHGRVFNVGSDEPIEIGELAAMVCRTLNADCPIEYVTYDEAFGQGFDDLRHRRPDLTRLREAVEWSPRYPLEQTIRDLADLYERGQTPLESTG